MMGHSVVTCQISQNKEWRTTNSPLHHPTGQEAEMDDGNRWYGGNRRRSLRDHVPDPAVGRCPEWIKLPEEDYKHG